MGGITFSGTGEPGAVDTIGAVPDGHQETAAGSSWVPEGADGLGLGTPLPSRRWLRPSYLFVTLAVLAGSSLFVLWALHPNLLVRGTTPAGGDMGAHVWGPAYLRDHLLHHGRLTGWAPDWYAGFPALTFYFPLPSILIVLVSKVITYNVAFKLVTVLGLLTLPLAAWAFGKLARMRHPGPLLLAVATIPFLFERGTTAHPFTIYGGNVASTLAGEFSFSISLAAGLVFLGLLVRNMDSGRGRVLAAVALAVTGLSHLLPTMFVLVGGVVLFALLPTRRRLSRAGWSLMVGGLLAAFWSVPFLLRLGYTNDMGWEAITKHSEQMKNLFQPDMHAYVALAAVGAVASVALWLYGAVTQGLSSEEAMRHRVGVTLTAVGAVAWAAFRFNNLPGQLWNARALPFWYLSIYLLAGVAIAESTLAVASLLARDPERPHPLWGLASPVLSLGVILVVVGLPLGFGPAKWFGSTKDHNFVVDWARWNYSGYEDSGKARRVEYQRLIAAMGDVGRREGCGRAMWEYEPELDQMGTPLALMLLPYWTHGCIGSMEGLYFESSATTAYHFLNASYLSKNPSNPMRDLPYNGLNVPEGVKRLQLMGVRYYMALTPDAQSQADANRDLRLLTTVGPFQVIYSNRSMQRTWKIYEVAGSDLVEPLQYQPAVMKGIGRVHRGWLGAAVRWYQSLPSGGPLAASGPRSWERVRLQVGRLSAHQIGSDVTLPTPQLKAISPQPVVSRIRTSDDRISFDVDRPGEPVLVKASYFPNWHASGARGPWRVAPNQMVVIPTRHHVSLRYGWTPVDLTGWALTLLGLALAGVAIRRGVRTWIVPDEALAVGAATAVPSPWRPEQLSLFGVAPPVPTLPPVIGPPVIGPPVIEGAEPAAPVSAGAAGPSQPPLVDGEEAGVIAPGSADTWSPGPAQPAEATAGEAPPVDAGPVDAGPVDAGLVDAEPAEASPVEPVAAAPVSSEPPATAPTERWEPVPSAPAADEPAAEEPADTATAEVTAAADMATSDPGDGEWPAPPEDGWRLSEAGAAAPPEPELAPQREAEPAQPEDGPSDSAGDGAPGGSTFGDLDRHLVDAEPGSLGPQDELGIEEVGAEPATTDEGVEGLAPEDLHAVGVRDAEPEPQPEHEREPGGHEPAG